MSYMEMNFIARSKVNFEEILPPSSGEHVLHKCSIALHFHVSSKFFIEATPLGNFLSPQDSPYMNKHMLQSDRLMSSRCIDRYDKTSLMMMGVLQL